MINYNYEYLLQHNSFIKEIYEKYFPNIIFISPKNKNITLETNLNISNTTNNIIYCPESHSGSCSYICIKKVYEKFPNMDGYIFLMDDVFIKFWELKHLNFSIPWLLSFYYERASSWSHSTYKRAERVYKIHPK